MQMQMLTDIVRGAVEVIRSNMISQRLACQVDGIYLAHDLKR